MGEFLRVLLGDADPRLGGPYVHTFRMPQQPVFSRLGRLVYRPPQHPSFTLTERPVADVVREAGFSPVPHRIEVTAEFCVCPACREERCEQ